MSDDAKSLWCSAPADSLAWREWGAGAVVFNQGTGNTHYLDEFAAPVLHDLVAHPDGITADALVTRLGRSADLPDVSDPASAISEVLREFARLGLARRMLA
jgi:PqqD family protein of HPr-rel-A system